MTDNLKHSTSYYHEAIAHAFEMFKNGYEPVMETPFQPRRLGSAFVTEYKLVRESLDDFDGSDEAYMKINDEAVKAIEENQLSITQKWEVEDNIQELLAMLKYGAENPDVKFSGVVEMTDKKGMKARVPGIIGCKAISGIMSDVDQGKIEPLPEELLDRMQDLRDKAQANRGREEALNELAAHSQELGMYDKDNGIFDRLVESIESAQNNPESCVSTIVEVDKGQVKVYSKSELDEMHWNELKPILDGAGIRGRRRANLIRDFLKWQEEKGE